MSNEKSSFDYMWDLLNPPREFLNMRNKCETNLWNTLSIHMQHRVYRLIRDKKRRVKHGGKWRRSMGLVPNDSITSLCGSIEKLKNEENMIF